MFSQNCFAFGHVKSTGEKLSDFPANTIVQVISKKYIESRVGQITAKILLVPSIENVDALRAVLSLSTANRNEIYTLQERVTDLVALNLSSDAAKVLEIDIKKGNKVEEMNILPLIDRIQLQKYDLYNQVIHFNEYGYRRSQK
jgi:hypothetical protein